MNLNRRCRVAARVASAALWLTWAVPSNAQQSSPQCVDPHATMLWEVQGATLADRGVTLHLFGSMHVGKADFYPLPEALEKRFQAAEHVVFEVDPRTASEPRAAAEMARRSLLPADQTLEQWLAPDTLASLEEVLSQQSLPVGDVTRFKPWMIGLLLADTQSRDQGFDSAWGSEAYFLERLPHGANVMELESLQAQLDMLDSLDPNTFMTYTLHDFADSAAQIEVLADAWRCGDHAELEAVLFADFADGAASLANIPGLDILHEQLFTSRNRVMAEGIQQMINSGREDYFVVVGAGHLLGKDSVVTLLQAAGFSVRAVRL